MAARSGLRPAGPEVGQPAIDLGTPGGSAAAEYERRRRRREAHLDKRWGRLAGVVTAITGEPQSTTAWARGAAGEVRVGKLLTEQLGGDAVVLNDRKVPGTRRNIDHLVIAPSGLWIVDAKNYRGRVERRDVGGWFRADERLYVGGRDLSRLVRGLDWQRQAVETALAGHEMVPVHTALCFTYADWALFAKPFRLEEAWVVWPKALLDVITRASPVPSLSLAELAAHLSTRLPAAVPGAGSTSR